MANYKGTHLLIILTLVFVGCKNQPDQKDNKQSKTDIKSIENTVSQKEQNNDNWVYHYNLKSDSLKFLYDLDAIKILKDGRILDGREQIIDFILSDSLKVISTKSDSVIVANKERAIEYEISEIIYEGNKRYKNLIIWQTKDAERRRIFEFVIKVEETKSDYLEIDKRRELWINLCNKNDAKRLIEEMYSKNTLYFNHKPIVKGRDLLINEYQYMNNENYELFLQPEIVNQVNDRFVFEIGQCSGSYKGKYILIWRKDKDKKWRIFIDSNI